METINVTKGHILIMLKGNTYDKIIYEIVPEITYSGKELFESEELSLFTNINEHESYYDLIIVGKKILKNQIDHIKNEILQKKVCNLNTVTFEYEDIMEDVSILVNYYDFYVKGKYGYDEIMFKLQRNTWIEIVDEI